MVSRKALHFGALSGTLLSLTAIASAQHNNPQLLRTKDVSISGAFTPFGNNVNFNKFGDDGSSCVLDAAGILIWADASGNYRTIPNSELATPLYVSNNELIVWKNHFADYDFYVNKPKVQVSLYTLATDGTVTETPIALEGKEVMNTPSLTTTTGNLLLVTTERNDNGTDTINPARNLYDDAVIRSYRVTFQGNAQRLSQVSRYTLADSLQYTNSQNGPDITSVGWGSDGSVLFRNVSLDSNTFFNQLEFLWMNGDGLLLKIDTPQATTLTGKASDLGSVLYLSNNRLVYYRNAADLNGDGTFAASPSNEAAGYFEVARNSANLLTATASLGIANTQTPLNFPKVTRVGYDQYFYTFTTTPLPNGTVTTYKLSGASGATLVRTAQPPVNGLGNAEVKAINPAPALKSDGVTPNPNAGLGSAVIIKGESVIWLNSNAQGYNVLPAASNLAEPMFVTDTEAVFWDNAHAPVDGTGNHPLVRIKHYNRVALVITPTQIYLDGLPGPTTTNNGPGRVVLDTTDITLDPDEVGWIFTTAEKPSGNVARFRTYRLRGPDTDGDGLDNAEEAVLGTNPNLADTDGDGLSDYDEVRNRKTNPLDNDTDNDTLTDGQEVALGTDPLNGNDPFFIDTDGDGLTDYQELITYGTNKSLTDTDGDGLTDYEEVVTYGTDPLNPDTDGDGVPDGVEVKVNHTDPNVPSFGGNPGSPTNYADPAVNGAYTGLVFDNTGTPIGTLSLKVTNKGAFTGTDQGIGMKGSLRGSFDANGVCSIGLTTLPGVTGVNMQFVQDAGLNYQIQGTFTTPSAAKQYFELRRAAYSRTNPTALVGAYTFAANAGVVTGPTGDLIGTATVTSDGKATLKVLLPDNQTGTWSGTVNNGDLLPLFSSVTTNARIAVAGNLVFRDIPNASDFDGQVRMIRLSGIGSDAYKTGYDQTRTLEGSRFSSSVLIGLTSFPATTNNVVAQFADGAASGDSVIATWASNGQITIPRVNLYTFTGRYDKRTGLATSTYGIDDVSRGLSKAKLPCRAVPIQKQDRIAGHYYAGVGGGRFAFVLNDGTPAPITTLSAHSTGAPVPKTGGVYYVTILTPGAWEAAVVNAATVTWVTLDTASGTGDGAVTITVAANATGLKRTAQVQIAGQYYFIQQNP